MRVGVVPGRIATVLAAVALLSAGCATPGAPATTVGPTPSASPSTSPPDADRPPLAADLTDGVPVTLGSAGHWVIRDGRAFTATADGVEAIELATGSTAWRASFGGDGEPWDATPTVGLSADGATVHALRTVDTPAGARLELLSVAAETGAVAANPALDDPDGRWRVDLPPHILAADAGLLVLADDPESGAQVGAVDLPTGSVAWAAEDQGLAGGDPVLTRSGTRDPRTGGVRWEASFRLGPFLGRSGDRVVVGDVEAGRVVWLDAGGAEAAAAAADPDSCVAAASVLVCAGEAAAGYDLATGEQLWTAGAAQAVSTYRDWAYLWRTEARGEVRDGRTGELLVTDAELPRIRHSDPTGILVEADGLRWVVTG